MPWLARVRLGAIGLALASLGLGGCGGHEARTLRMSTALDEGNPKEAIASINEELEVKSSKDLPKEVVGDNALLVLDRATVQQSILQFDDSKRDFQAADKAIEMLTCRSRRSTRSALQIATWIDRLISDAENETLIAAIKGEVNEYMKAFPLY